MRKILFILATITLMTVGVNAQVMEIYNGSTLIKTYTQEQADRVVFEKPPIIKVTSITVTGSKSEINVGESLKLSATVSPSNATNKSVRWSSSDRDYSGNSVVTVSSSGLVKALNPGSANIYADAMDGSGVYGKYTITVHGYVDLGLSVKWATFNVGASKPEEFGDYFAWGETKPMSTFDWDWTYFDFSFSKYAQNKKTTLDLSDDAAHVNWGGSWRMPTEAEQYELCEKCTWTWTTSRDGVNGYRVTSKTNGNSIFLPAAGFRDVSSLYNAGSHGYYWSSSLDVSDSRYAYCLYFSSSRAVGDDGYRFYGHSVRAVCP